MQSPAAAIAWEFRHRHRWGWAAITGFLALLAGIRLWAAQSGVMLTIADDETFGLFVVGPITASFLYVITIFTFGYSGDVAARESMLPSRFHRLPVTTSSLTGWLVLYGSLVMVPLWALSRMLLIFPPGMKVPVVWPGVLAVVILVWAQGLIWMPYGFRGARVIATIGWLCIVDAIVLLAVSLKLPEWVVVSLLLPQLPFALLLARTAVARARRGEVPDWSMGRGARSVAAAEGPAFSSPSRAQLWFEWRHHGWNFPALVAIVVTAELALFFTAGQTRSLVFLLLWGVLLTPPFLAKAAGATVRRTSGASDAHGISPFIATRPMTSAALVAAKLKVTVASTLIAWLFVAVSTPIAMMLSGTWVIVTDWFGHAAAGIGEARTATIVGVVAVTLLLSTWRQLVQSLYIGLTGREWLVKSNVFLTMFAIFVAVPAISWVTGRPRVLAFLWSSIPVVLATLVAAKTIVAIGVYRALSGRRVVSERVLLAGAGAWCAVVLALYVTLVWFWNTLFLPSYVMVMIAILIVPLARASAAPLGFDWNRHR